MGFTVGGPIGKPGHDNKLFFFYSHEFDPRSMTVTGGSVVNYRFPTALERASDFSQSVDNNGKLYPYIKDPLSSNTCSASNTSGCFKDGGVLGKIPADRLYGLGLKILNLYPMPNLAATNLPYSRSSTVSTFTARNRSPVPCGGVARLLRDAARKYKVAAQMGNQGYSHEGTRTAAEIVWSGDIGL